MVASVIFYLICISIPAQEDTCRPECGDDGKGGCAED